MAWNVADAPAVAQCPRWRDAGGDAQPGNGIYGTARNARAARRCRCITTSACRAWRNRSAPKNSEPSRRFRVVNPDIRICRDEGARVKTGVQNRTICAGAVPRYPERQTQIFGSVPFRLQQDLPARQTLPVTALAGVADGVEGATEVVGERVGGGDDILAGLGLDGAIPACGLYEFPD
jgi:hypothetical protein